MAYNDLFKKGLKINYNAIIKIIITILTVISIATIMTWRV